MRSWFPVGKVGRSVALAISKGVPTFVLFWRLVNKKLAFLLVKTNRHRNNDRDDREQGPGSEKPISKTASTERRKQKNNSRSAREGEGRTRAIFCLPQAMHPFRGGGGREPPDNVRRKTQKKQSLRVSYGMYNNVFYQSQNSSTSSININSMSYYSYSCACRIQYDNKALHIVYSASCITISGTYLLTLLVNIYVRFFFFLVNIYLVRFIAWFLWPQESLLLFLYR